MPTLWRAKQPYNVNVAATVAGLASLAHRAEIQPTVDALIAERERLYGELADVPYLQPYPSRRELRAVPGGGPDAPRSLKAALAARGILVRYYAKPGLENCIRSAPAGRSRRTRCSRRWRTFERRRKTKDEGRRSHQGCRLGLRSSLWSRCRTIRPGGQDDVGAEAAIVLGLGSGGWRCQSRSSGAGLRLGPPGGDDIVGGVADVGCDPRAGRDRGHRRRAAAEKDAASAAMRRPALGLPGRRSWWR